MKILPLLYTALLAFPLTAPAVPGDVGADDVFVDYAGANTGTYDHLIHFGPGSGEGIGSKRNAGFGQYGLDFYTGFQRRMTLENSGALSLTPAAGGSLTGRGLSITQSSSSNGPPPGNWAFNDIQISDSTNYGPDVFVSGLHIGYAFGGASATGGRLAFDSSLTLTSPTSSTNVNRNYVAGNFQAAADSGDGGTGLTVSTAKGSIFAISPTIRARNGATNLEQISGMEIDINAETGSSMRWKNGLIINYNANDFVGGAQIDNMISLCRYNGPGTGTLSTILGAKVGLEFGYGDGGGDPMRTNGTLIKATSNSNPTVATGIDFYDYNITGNLIQGKYSALGDNGGLFIGAGPSNTSTNVVAQGGQANVDINIAPKGSGLVKVGNAGSFSTGSHTVVVKWLKVKDDAGNVYYMPLYQ